MPRGTRAIHGAEVDASHHGSGHGLFTHIAVVEPWLAVTCWCEKDVVQVDQWIVRWLGATLSCGRPGCVAPDGDLSSGRKLTSSEIARCAPRYGKPNSLEYGSGSPDVLQTWAPVGKVLKHLPARGGSRVVRMIQPSDPARLRDLSTSAGRRVKRNRLSAFDTAMRREHVLELWRQNLNVRTIAKRLAIADWTVNNDLVYLRSKGKAHR